MILGYFQTRNRQICCRIRSVCQLDVYLSLTLWTIKSTEKVLTYSFVGPVTSLSVLYEFRLVCSYSSEIHLTVGRLNNLFVFLILLEMVDRVRNYFSKDFSWSHMSCRSIRRQSVLMSVLCLWKRCLFDRDSQSSPETAPLTWFQRELPCSSQESGHSC